MELSQEFIKSLIEWDSSGLMTVDSPVFKIEKPYDHYHIYFQDQEKYYPIHEDDLKEFQHIFLSTPA